MARLAKAAATVGPQLARAGAAARPALGRLREAAGPRLAELAAVPGRLKNGRSLKTWQYTATAATAGLALAACAATAAGPWDATGQRTAERDRAVALSGEDHGGSAATAGAPHPAPSAPTVLTALGGAVKAAPGVSGTSPAPEAFTAVLGPLLADPALGSRHTAAVVDVTSGRLLYGAGADDALTPASTTKIATAVAALSALGPDRRLTTKAALEPDTRELVLVGGGDPTLTARPANGEGWASLRTLAASTATALKKRGLTTVTLSYDTTLYAGSDLHPIGENPNLARVTPLTADEGRTDDSTNGPATRVADPAADATAKFADLLAADGIKTTHPGPSKATTRAETLATVTSPPLSALVERMLTNSDNDIAEGLARQTALATGVRADFAGGGAAITAQLTKLGLPVAGARFKDGSGLDRDDRLTTRLLTALLAKSADAKQPGLRPVLTGLPIAGFTGTLTSRYTQGAAGLIRAKTGTLTGVNALAGTVVDQDGRLLAFAFLADGTSDPTTAQSALDRTATALVGCGCG